MEYVKLILSEDLATLDKKAIATTFTMTFSSKNQEVIKEIAEDFIVLYVQSDYKRFMKKLEALCLQIELPLLKVMAMPEDFFLFEEFNHSNIKWGHININTQKIVDFFDIYVSDWSFWEEDRPEWFNVKKLMRYLPYSLLAELCGIDPESDEVYYRESLYKCILEGLS